MRILSLVGLLLVATSLPALVTDKPQGPERLAEVASALAGRTGYPAEHLATRVIAASVCWRMYPSGEGRWKLQKDDFIGRLISILKGFKAVDKVIAETEMPEEHREVLRADFARMALWPVRYRTPEMPAKHWVALVKSIPKNCTMVAVPAGKSLAGILAGIDPDFGSRSPLARKAVLDQLAAVNPRMRADGGFIAEVGEAKDGCVPGKGVDPLEQGMYGQLVQLVPEVGLIPVDGHQFEHLVVPVGKGKVWVCRYRLAPAELLVPDKDGLAKWADPPKLDLRNLPIVDTAMLKGLTPVELDLGGTRVADLSGLTGMQGKRNLEVLRLDGCPVSDLGPLSGLELTRLDLRGTAVTDLRPVHTAPLKHLDLRDCPATDLGPLAMSSLETLLLTEDGAYEDLATIAELASLEGKINGIPAADFVKENAAKRRTKRWDDPGDQARYAAPGEGPKAAKGCN